MNRGQNLGSSIKSESQTACLICSDMDWRPILLNRTLRGVTSLASNRTIINLIESLFVHFIAQVVKYYAKCAFLTFVQRPKVQYFPSIFISHLLSHFMHFTTAQFRLKWSVRMDKDIKKWTVSCKNERSFASKWKVSGQPWSLTMIHESKWLVDKKCKVLLKENCRPIKLRKTIQF